GVVAVAVESIVLAEGLGDLAGDRLGVARDLVPEAAVDVDGVIAGRAAAEDRLVVGIGLGLIPGQRLGVAGDDVVAPAGHDLVVARRTVVLGRIVGIGLGIAEKAPRL